jgi:phosphoserine phosphatase RsbU/P
MTTPSNLDSVYILTADGQRRAVPLSADRLTLGRARDNDLAFPEDVQMSRSHLAIERDDDGWRVVDLGSKNGTFLHGERLGGPRRLRTGDVIRAGQLTLTFAPAGTSVTGPGMEFYAEPTPVPPTMMVSLEELFQWSGRDLKGSSTSGVQPARPRPLPSAPGAMAGATRRAELFRHPAFLAVLQAGRDLSRHLPQEELFETILVNAVAAVGAERGAIATLEGRDLVTRSIRGEGIRLSTGVRDRVLETRTSLLVHEVPGDEAFAERQSLFDQNVLSMMAAPLQTDEQVLGLLYVDTRIPGRTFDSDDLSLLTLLGNVAALRLEQDRLARAEQHRLVMVRELEQAAEIQRGLLPEQAPEIPGFEALGFNVPCRTVGGDYFDFLRGPGGRTGLVLGDVAGKGLPAAILMASLQASVTALSEDLADPAQILERLDRTLSAKYPSNRFTTLFLGFLDAVGGQLIYGNAGHNPPLVVRGSGEVERLAATGTALGLFPDLGYRASACALAPGDVIALFSDGVTECARPDGEEFGEERLIAILRAGRERSLEALTEEVRAAIEAWGGGAAFGDDVTLVLVRRTGHPG